MKTEIMKSLKRFGGAALVAAMLLTTAAPAVLADEMNPEAAQSEESITADEDKIVIEDMDDAEDNQEEALAVAPEETAEEIQVTEVMPSVQLEFLEETVEDARLLADNNAENNGETSAESIRAMADNMYARLTNSNESFTTAELEAIIRDLTNARNVLNNNKGKKNFKSADVKAARGAVTKAIETASAIKVIVETQHTDRKPAPAVTPEKDNTTPSSEGKDKPSEEVKPSETKPAETKPAETKPAEGKTDENIPANNDDGKGLLDYIKDIIGIVDSGAGAADKVVDVAKKIKDNLPGVSETKEIAGKMTEELAKAGIKVAPETLNKAAEAVAKYGSEKANSDGKGNSTNGGKDSSNSTVTTNDNGTTYVNNGGTIIINNGDKDNNGAGNNGGSTGTGTDKAEEKPQNTKKYTLVQWFSETTTNSEEANNIMNYYKKDGYSVNVKRTEVVKNQVSGLGGLIKIDIPFVTKKEYRYDINGEKRTEISAAQAKDYLEKFRGGKFEILDENGSRVSEIAD